MWTRVSVSSITITLVSILLLAAIGSCMVIPDPLPGSSAETFMALAVVGGERVVGYRYVLVRPDPISVATIERTMRVQEPGFPESALQLYMRVRVLGAQGAVRSTQYIDDPLSRFVEVPGGPDGESGFWTELGTTRDSFLVAAPYFSDAQTIEFTRFSAGGEPLDAGFIDLSDISLGRAKTPLEAAAYAASDAEHATIINNGPPASHLDLLILADGFRNTTADRMAFNQKVHDLLNYLWTIPLYYQIRTSVNVHTAYLPSTVSGSDHPAEGIDVDTPFGTAFDCSGLDRLICVSAAGATLAYQVAADAPGNYGAGSADAILILVNDSEYGGGGGSIITASVNAGSPEIASHEMGHTIADLADEYESEYNDAKVLEARTKVNCSGPVAVRADLKWIALVDPTTAIPTEVDDGTCTRTGDCTTSTLPVGTVGMYEGAGYTACGSFRPTTACQMRCYVGYFCPVCDGAFRSVVAPFPGPVVDVYVRDNQLDVGNPPSPTDVEDPPGSGNRVKPYQSPDIRVDAPPFGDAVHENPVAGVTNHVYVTAHNRGSNAAALLTDVDLHIAEATGGAPPFPGASWTLIGTESGPVPGQEGEVTLMFTWDAPPDTPRHTCALAIADAVGDPAPAPGAELADFVRNNNNVAWKNLHVVRLGPIQGNISNFQQRTVPVVVRIEAAGLPVGTNFMFSHDGTLTFVEFEPSDARQMDLGALNTTSVSFTRAVDGQEWLALRTDLPGGSPATPFQTPFTLQITPPGGVEVGTVFTVTVDVLAVDPETGALGTSIGGNTYNLTLE